MSLGEESFVILSSEGYEGEVAPNYNLTSPECAQMDIRDVSAHAGAVSRIDPHLSRLTMTESDGYDGFDTVEDDFNNDILDQYSKSIIIEDVPNGMDDLLEMFLQDKTNDGGPVLLPLLQKGNTRLATFQNSEVAANFIEKGQIRVASKTMKISRPALVETPMESMNYYAQFTAGPVIAQNVTQCEIKEEEICAVSDTDRGTGTLKNEEVVKNETKSPEIVVIDNVESSNLNEPLVDISSVVTGSPVAGTQSPSACSRPSPRPSEIVHNVQHASPVPIDLPPKVQVPAKEALSSKKKKEKRIIPQKIAQDCLPKETSEIQKSRLSGEQKPNLNTCSSVKGQNCLVYVNNIPGNMWKIVEIVLKSSEKGGPTEAVEYNEAERWAKVIFRDSKVAEKLLREGELTIGNEKMTITKIPQTLSQIPSTSQDSKGDKKTPKTKQKITRKTLSPVAQAPEIQKVVNKTLSPDFDTSQQKEKRKGEGIKSSCKNEISNSSDAARASAAQNPSDSDDFKSASEGEDQTDSEESILERTITVSNCPISIEELQLILEDKRTTGVDNASVKEIHSDSKSNGAVVTFTKQKVAEDLISKGCIQYKGQSLTISRPVKLSSFSSEDNNARLRIEGAPHTKNCVTPHASPPEPFQTSELFDTIKVSNIPQSAMGMIQLYFENKRWSGGGEIEEFTAFSETGKAFIRFRSPAVALRVTKQVEHKFEGVVMKVAPREMSPTVTSQAILVTGIKQGSHSKDLLSLYFESAKAGRGNYVEHIFMDAEHNSAVITFSEQKIAQCVLKHHTLNGCPLTVTLLAALPPPTIILENFEDKMLLVKHLPDITTFESLKQFIETESDAKLHTWIPSKKQTTFFLQFQESPDYVRLRSLVCRKPYQGKMISIQRIPKTTKIHVHGIKKSTSEDFLKLYFESPRAGEGDVVNVELNPDSGSAIVEFTSCNDVSKVLSRLHTLEDQSLQVKQYYPSMELSITEPPLSIIPTRVRMEISDNLASSFIGNVPEILREVQNELEKISCTVKWPKTGGMTIELISKDQTRSLRGWDIRGKAVIQKYLKDVKVKVIKIDPDIWDEWKESVKFFEERENSQIKIEHDDNSFTTALVALTAVVSEYEKKLNDIETDLKKSHAVISKKFSIPSHQIELLHLCELWKEIKSKIKDIKIEVGTSDVTYSGTSEEITQARVMDLEKLNEMLTENIHATVAALTCLRTIEAKSEIDACLRKENLIATWTADERNCRVLAFNSDDLKKAVRIIKENVSEQSVNLDETSKHLLGLPKWKDFLQSMLNEFNTLQISVSANGNAVNITCLANSSVKVIERVNAFFEKNSVVNETVPMEFGYYDLIRRYMAEDLAKLSIILKQSGGQFEASSNEEENQNFKLSGTAAAVKAAKSALFDLADKIIPGDHEIERMSRFFEERQGKDALAGLEKKHRVSIQMDCKISAKPQRSVDHTIRCKVQLRKGQYIYLVDGDITKYRVDAIVNAANENLDHGGGIARAISDAAGPDMQQECKMYDKTQGPLLPGQTYVSKPYNLPCKHIIHTVGPRWRNGVHGEHEKLRQAVYSSLEEAMKRNLRTIAMPAISTGIFGFPIDIATGIILSVVGEFFEQCESSSLKEVHIIDIDKTVLNCFEKELNDVKFTLALEETSSTAQSGNQRQSQDRATVNLAASASSLSGSNFKPTSQPNAVITNQNLLVSLQIGSIVKLQVDAIVNTVDISLDLNNGAVSKSILNEAGPNIQSDCYKNRPTNFSAGDVIVTPGHKLKCPFVYHGSVIAWDKAAGGCEQVIRKFLKNIFRQAHIGKLTSIAIPAIGTGNLNVPHALVANIMFEEIDIFSQTNPQATLKNVMLVVYDKDQKSINAFEAKLRSLLSPQSHGSSGDQTCGHQAGSMYVNVPSGSGAQASGGAPSCASNITYNDKDSTARIGSVTMEIKSGDITKERADAIVNSTNKDLSLTAGMVSKAIGDAAGDAVKQECQAGKVDTNGIFISKGGKLPSKHIIHIVAGSDRAEWIRIIENSLRAAEKKKYAHVSFPLLGTGNASQSAADMATTMLEALNQFEINTHPKSLKKVTVCIFQQEMVKQFSDAVAAYARQPQSGKQADFGFQVDGQGGARPKVLQTRPSFSPSPKHVLQIYALDQQSITKVIDDIQQIIRDAVVDTVLESRQDAESIKKLTNEQVDRIRELQNCSAVQIEVERTQHINRIRVRCPGGDSVAIIQEIYQIFKEADYLYHKKSEADLVKKMVNWCYETNGKFVPYPDETNVIIEKAFGQSMELVEWGGGLNAEQHKIIFKENLEYFSGKTIRVKRTTREIIPANWDPMGETEMWKTVPLAPTDKEYLEVEQYARSSAATTLGTVVKIERIQNLSQYKQYSVKKEAMEKANPAVQNERILWHGTDAATVEKINSTVFNRSFGGKNATAYGHGSYFAVNFSYSANPIYSPPDPTTGLRHIYQCRVLVGDYTLGTPDLQTPPQKPPPATSLYDSVVDNVANPNLFVVFYDVQAYPEYLIYFK